LHFHHLQHHSSHPSHGFSFSLPAAESVSKDQNHDFGQLIRVCVSSTFMKHLVCLSVCLSAGLAVDLSALSTTTSKEKLKSFWLIDNPPTRLCFATCDLPSRSLRAFRI
jgi:uncharacterized protein (UPF0276 family)